MMKPLSIYLLLTIALLSESFGQKPDWSVNPANYNHSMVIVGGINLQRTELAHEHNMIAAFVGDECRGVANTLFQEENGRYISYLLVYSNESEEEIAFKCYNAEENSIYTIPKTVGFEVNGLVGDLSRPYIWSEQTLNNEARILSFAFPEDDETATIDGNTIYASVLSGTEMTALTATFTLSDGATLWLEGVEQISEETEHNYADTVTFTVRSEDEQIFQDYDVIVSVADDLVEEQLNAVNTFTPNGDGVNDYWVVDNIELYQSYQLRFFNAVGEMVFESDNYQNDWDATFNGKRLPEGVYFYVFSNTEKEFRGTVTIFR